MSHIAARGATLCPLDLPTGAVDGYVDATFERFERALAALAPQLAEPRVTDPARARRRLDLLVETLTGIAIGAAVGAVAARLRRGGGAEVRAAVEARLAVIARQRPPAALVAVGDDDGALARAFPRLLWPRLCAAVGVTRTCVRELEDDVRRVAPAQPGAVAQVLAVLAADDASALAFADHLAIGWATFAAVVAGTAPPVVPDDARHARCAATWRAWTRQLAGARAVVAPAMSHGEIVGGAILRVA